jgi:hypothetical protein
LLPVTGSDGQPLTGPERDSIIEDAEDQTVPVAEDRAARDLIAAACSPYCTRLNAESWDEDVRILVSPVPAERGIPRRSC